MMIDDSFVLALPTRSNDGCSTPFECDDISPFPTFDDASLISGNSIETERQEQQPYKSSSFPSVATELEESDQEPVFAPSTSTSASASVSTSSSEEDEDEYDTTDDESSQPTIPEDIGYVIDINGASLLANLNKKLLEHRYGKDYTFDKVPVQTKIDMDDAVSTIERMQNLLGEDNEFQVIPRSPSSAEEMKKSSPKNKDEKLAEVMHNLTKDDLQVLYKAVMGKEMPVEESLDSREDSETGQRLTSETSEIAALDDNPLGIPLPSILEESLSGSSTDGSSSWHSEHNEIVNLSAEPEIKETIAVDISKPTPLKQKSNKFCLMKKLVSRLKNKATTPSKKKSGTDQDHGIKRTPSKLELHASSVAKSRVAAKLKSKEDDSRDDVPPPEAKTTSDAPTPEDDSREVTPAPAVEEKTSQDVDERQVINANDGRPRDTEISESEAENSDENKENEAGTNCINVKEKNEDPKVAEVAERIDSTDDVKDQIEPVTDSNNDADKKPDSNPGISGTEEVKEVVDHNAGELTDGAQVSDTISVVVEPNGNGPEIEVLSVLDFNQPPTEVPVASDSAPKDCPPQEQVKKKLRGRLGKSLRERIKNMPGSPSNKMLATLTEENPVIEIPLSEVKPKKSLLAKYDSAQTAEVKPTEKVTETPVEEKQASRAKSPEPAKKSKGKASDRKSPLLQSPLKKGRKDEAVSESEEIKTVGAKAKSASPKTVPDQVKDAVVKPKAVQEETKGADAKANTKSRNTTSKKAKKTSSPKTVPEEKEASDAKTKTTEEAKAKKEAAIPSLTKAKDTKSVKTSPVSVKDEPTKGKSPKADSPKASLGTVKNEPIKAITSPLQSSHKDRKGADAKDSPVSVKDESNKDKSPKDDSPKASLGAVKNEPIKAIASPQQSSHKDRKGMDAKDASPKFSVVDDTFAVKDRTFSNDSAEKDSFDLRRFVDEDSLSVEETGGFLCGAVNPLPKDDWITKVERSFTRMLDFWDRTPGEAFEEDEVYRRRRQIPSSDSISEEPSRSTRKSRDADDGSVRSRSAKSVKASAKSRSDRSVDGDRSVKSVKSRSDKSMRSDSKSKSDRSVKSRAKSRSGRSVSDKSLKSRGDKSVRSRSKSRTDRSVKPKSSDQSLKSRSDKSARSRSKHRSDKSVATCTKSVKPTGAKSQDAKPSTAKSSNAKAVKVSSSEKDIDKTVVDKAPSPDKSTCAKSTSKKACSNPKTAGVKTAPEKAKPRSKSTNTKPAGNKAVPAKARTSPVPSSKTKTPRRPNNSPKPEEPVASAPKQKSKAKPVDDSKSMATKSQHKPKGAKAK